MAGRLDQSAGVLGAQMKAARVSRGLGLRELAQQLGMSPSSLSEFEHGKSRPGSERLRALSAALEVPIEQDPPTLGLLSFRHWRDYGVLEVDAVSQAGLDLFVERGYHGSTMRMIAERCGITVAGIYHHVPSKHDLLVRVMRRAMTELVARCEAADAEGVDSEERLRNLVESMVLFHVIRMPWAYVVTNEARTLQGVAATEMLEGRRHVRQLFEDAVAGRRGSAQRRVPDRVTARAIVTMTTSIPDWYQDAGQPEPRLLALQYIELAEGMVHH